MAGSDDIKKSKQEVEAMRQSMDRFSKEISANMDRAAKDFVDAMGKARRGVKGETEAMWNAFKSGQDKFINSKGIEMFGAQMKAHLRSIAAVAPQVFGRIGVSAAEVFSRTSNSASRFSAEYIAIEMARVSHVQSILENEGMSREEASKTAFNAVAKGYDGIILHAEENSKQLAATAGKDTRLQKLAADAAIKNSDRIKDAAAKANDYRNKNEQQSAQVRSRLVNQAATAAIETDRGAFGSFARSNLGKISGLHALADAEQIASKKIASGQDAGVFEGAGLRQLLSGAVGGISGIVNSLAPLAESLGVVGGAFGILFDSLDKTKRVGASSLAALAVQGKVSEKSFTGVGASIAFGSAIAEKSMKEGLGDAAVRAGESLEGLNMKSAAVAQSLGDLGGARGVRDFIVGLTKVQFIAPLAGVSGERAMQMIAQAAKSIDLAKNDPALYFNRLRSSAHMAGTTVDDFVKSMGDMDSVGAVFGQNSDSMMKDLSGLMMGFKGMQGQSNVMIRAYAGLIQRPIETQAAFSIAAHGGNLNEAAKRLQESAKGRGQSGIIAAEVSDVMQTMRKNRMRFDTPGQQFMAAKFLEPQFGKQMSDMFFFNEKVRNQLTKESIDPKALSEAIETAMKEADPAKAGADLMRDQKTALEAILGVLTELTTYIARYITTGPLKYAGDPGTRAMGMHIMNQASDDAFWKVKGNETHRGK